MNCEFGLRCEPASLDGQGTGKLFMRPSMRSLQCSTAPCGTYQESVYSDHRSSTIQHNRRIPVQTFISSLSSKKPGERRQERPVSFRPKPTAHDWEIHATGSREDDMRSGFPPPQCYPHHTQPCDLSQWAYSAQTKTRLLCPSARCVHKAFLQMCCPSTGRVRIATPQPGLEAWRISKSWKVWQTSVTP